MYITGSVSAHGAVKPLATQVIFIPNYPAHPINHPPPPFLITVICSPDFKGPVLGGFLYGQLQYYMGGDTG